MRGRVAVTNLAAAAAQWTEIHVPRMPRIDHAPLRGAATLTDPETGFPVTARELFAERDALAILTGALIAVLLAGELDEQHAAALKLRVTGRLACLAPDYGANELAVAAAENELARAIELLRAIDDDNNENEQEI